MTNIDWENVESVSKGILELIPQQKPFRFIDRIIEIDESYITGQYTFKDDEYFYKGHFPGNPVTPGVILTECMAQIGVCSLSCYLLLKEGFSENDSLTTLFTEADVEFLKPVLPGETVTVKAKKIFWRRKKIKCETTMFLENGEIAAQGTLAGIGVQT